MKITKQRIREIVEETLSKRIEEQEPQQTSAGRQVDKQLAKAVNLDKAMDLVNTPEKYIEHLNKMIKLGTQGMDNKTQARSIFQKWASQTLRNKDFWK